MSEPSVIEAAIERLHASIDAVEGAVVGLLEGVAAVRSREAELALLAEDRARLGEALDAANARTAKLGIANREVARRLDQAADTIRTVLAGREG